MTNKGLIAIIRDFIVMMTKINDRHSDEYSRGYDQALKDMGSYLDGIESVTNKGEK
jgi:hypothetical protein